MSKTFKLHVVAPDRPAIEEEAVTVMLPGEVGEFGVMAGHMTFMSSLRPGTLRVIKEKQRDLYFVSGGFAEVNQGSLTVLAEAYERANEIDVERAQKSKKLAEEFLAKKEEGKDPKPTLQALDRAEARLKVVEEFKAINK